MSRPRDKETTVKHVKHRVTGQYGVVRTNHPHEAFVTWAWGGGSWEDRSDLVPVLKVKYLAGVYRRKPHVGDRIEPWTERTLWR